MKTAPRPKRNALTSPLGPWASIRIFRDAFQEQGDTIRDILRRAENLIQTPPDTPAAFAVHLARPPSNLAHLSRNLFSTLFQTVYHLLDISPPRRRLYGRINYLFRLWVTSADNLLDTEDKVTLPIRMPGSSRIMRQVVTLMAADRILGQLLEEAVRDSVLTRAEADRLSAASLQVLLPSAAQEASEEGGITTRPRPDYVRDTIHRLKTGLLFQLPFLGPDHIEPSLHPHRRQQLKQALLDFGIACQILDDLRDMARDFRERRHNYVLSLLTWTHHPYLQHLQRNPPELTARIYLDIPDIALSTARQAIQAMTQSFAVLGAAGLCISPARSQSLAESFLPLLDLGDLPDAA